MELFNTALVNVLLVRVSVVALPTNVSAVPGKLISTSDAIDAGANKVMVFVPLSVPSFNTILPPTVVLVAEIVGAEIVGVVNVLLVRVSVVQ